MFYQVAALRKIALLDRHTTKHKHERVRGIDYPVSLLTLKTYSPSCFTTIEC